jgi:hypothetical protein
MSSEEISAITNYHLTNQWASSLNADKAFKEILDLKAKYNWINCPESISFIARMHEDLPKILNIIKLQEKQNAVLKMANEKLNGYIKANNLADELILDELRDKYQFDI